VHTSQTHHRSGLYRRLLKSHLRVLQCLMVPWDDKVSKFSYNPGGEASALFVPTVETTRLSYFLDSLVTNRWGTTATCPRLYPEKQHQRLARQCGSFCIDSAVHCTDCPPAFLGWVLLSLAFVSQCATACRACSTAAGTM